MNSAEAFEPPFIAHQPTQSASSSRRKRAAADGQDINPKLVAKRAKAAERQRRKRERDRQKFQQHDAAVRAQAGLERQQDDEALQQAHAQAQVEVVEAIAAQAQAQTQQNVINTIESPPMQHQDVQTQTQAPPQTMTSDEEAKREKVRAAARERQRKHRELVKRRKLMELGVQMGEGGLIPEELTYTLNPDGTYAPAHPPPDGNALAGPSNELAEGENAFLPNGTAQTGGQTFAGYVLLALSCSPLLKQHLLRQLHMTNEDLSSLEPVLCAAFEQWDHHRREAFAAEQMKMQARSDNASDEPVASAGATSSSINTFAPTSTETAVTTDETGNDSNEFRTRFHRSIVAPSPFAAATTASPTTSAGDVVAQQAHVIQQTLPTSIDPRLSRLLPTSEFAEMVAKMAAAASAAAAGNAEALANAVTELEAEKMVNGTGVIDGEEASDKGEVEKELGAEGDPTT